MKNGTQSVQLTLQLVNEVSVSGRIRTTSPVMEYNMKKSVQLAGLALSTENLILC